MTKFENIFNSPVMLEISMVLLSVTKEAYLVGGSVRDVLFGIEPKDFDFVVFHSGWIPEKFHEVSDVRFCFVHLDVDLFQPTLDSLSFFYDKMSPGGIILCDDYGFITCPGARKAMNSFFADKPEEIVSLPTGQGFVVKRYQ